MLGDTVKLKYFIERESTTKKPTSITNKYPDDAIYLPENMRNQLLTTQNLTKDQAINLINKASVENIESVIASFWCVNPALEHIRNWTGRRTS